MTFEEKREFINQAFTFKTFDKGENNERTITIFNNEEVTPLYGKKGTELEEAWERFKHICFEKEMEIDNYYYEWMAEQFEEIKVVIQNCKTEEEAIKAIEEMESYTEADIYTNNLTQWLNSNNNRVYYLGEALGMGYGERKDGFELLAGAQMIEKEEVYNIANQVAIEFLKN
jgi:hypothetical protein